MGLTPLLSACGGGGGGGGNGLPAAEVSYTGITAQATLDPGNTDTTTVTTDLAMVLDESNSAEYVLGVTSNTNTESESKSQARNIITKYAEDFVKNKLNENQLVTGVGLIEIGNCSLYGGSDGSVTGEVTQQNSTSARLVMNFNNLCLTDNMNYKVEMNGSVYLTVRGQNLNDQFLARIDSMEMYMPGFDVTFTDLSVAPIEVATITFTETITISFTYDQNGNPDTYSISVVINIEYSGSVYRLGASGSYDYFSDVALSSESLEFYHPDYGYVEYNVTTPFTYNCPDGTPDAGQVTVTAANGTATLTVNSCNNYTVDVSSLTVPIP